MSGFFVMKWGDRYGSVAWFATREEAQKLVDWYLMTGYWQGMPPYVEPESRLGSSWWSISSRSRRYAGGSHVEA